MKEDILDKYALQILSDSDKIWLQKALKADPSFQKELDLHVEIVRGIEIHTEKLFDAAFVELNAMADESIINHIDEVEKSLEIEGFFAPIPEKQSSIDKNIADKEIFVQKDKTAEIKAPQNVVSKTLEEPQNLPNEELTKEATTTQTLIIPPISTPSTTEKSEKALPPQKDWVKTIAILLVILLTILLLWQNL